MIYYHLQYSIPLWIAKYLVPVIEKEKKEGQNANESFLYISLT